MALVASMATYAQDYSVPAASPKQSVEQQFSYSKISLEYSRPAVKGRKIFGDLVPYNQVWRAGANATTKITFAQKVIFGTKEVAAGTYGIYIIPQASEWKVILSKDAYSWGAYNFDEKQNVAEVTVKIDKLAAVQEYFTIALNPTSENSLNLVFSWDKVQAVVAVQAANQELVTKVTDKLREVKQAEREANKK